MEAIILAGGFGKRLQNHIKKIPKPMAPINNRPFLDYIFYYLKNYGIKKVILSVYYKSEVIKQYYNSIYNVIKITYSNDEKPLGTGGAIKAALAKTKNKNVFVINGDTYFDVDLHILMSEHIINNNDITLSIKPMSDFDRYGFVMTDSKGRIVAFEEKKFQEYGKIDGGIYLINNNIFKTYKGNVKFSFTDFIKNNLKRLKVGSVSFDELFIDIGTPKDLERAQKILKNHL